MDWILFRILNALIKHCIDNQLWKLSLSCSISSSRGEYFATSPMAHSYASFLKWLALHMFPLEWCSWREKYGSLKQENLNFLPVNVVLRLENIAGLLSNPLLVSWGTGPLRQHQVDTHHRDVCSQGPDVQGLDTRHLQIWTFISLKILVRAKITSLMLLKSWWTWS